MKVGKSPLTRTPGGSLGTIPGLPFLLFLWLQPAVTHILQWRTVKAPPITGYPLVLISFWLVAVGAHDVAFVAYADHAQHYTTETINFFLMGILFRFFFFYVRYSTQLYLPPLRFHCVEGCWDRTQDSCDYGIGCQTL